MDSPRDRGPAHSRLGISNPHLFIGDTGPGAQGDILFATTGRKLGLENFLLFIFQWPYSGLLTLFSLLHKGKKDLLVQPPEKKGLKLPPRVLVQEPVDGKWGS